MIFHQVASSKVPILSAIHPSTPSCPTASRAQFPAQLKGTTTSAGPRAAPDTWRRVVRVGHCWASGRCLVYWRRLMGYLGTYWVDHIEHQP